MIVLFSSGFYFYLPRAREMLAMVRLTISLEFYCESFFEWNDNFIYVALTPVCVYCISPNTSLIGGYFLRKFSATVSCSLSPFFLSLSPSTLHRSHSKWDKFIGFEFLLIVLIYGRDKMLVVSHHTHRTAWDTTLLTFYGNRVVWNILRLLHEVLSVCD